MTWSRLDPGRQSFVYCLQCVVALFTYSSAPVRLLSRRRFAISSRASRATRTPPAKTWWRHNPSSAKISDQNPATRGVFPHKTITYDHRHWKTRDPVRSPLDKPATARLVVGWVTTSESLVLYVLSLPFISSHFFPPFYFWPSTDETRSSQ